MHGNSPRQPRLPQPMVFPVLRWYPGLEGQEPIEYLQLLDYVVDLVGGVSFLLICV